MRTRTLSMLGLTALLAALLLIPAGGRAQDRPPAPPQAGWDGGDGPGAGRHGGMRGRAARAFRNLDLSKEQRDKIADLRDKQQRNGIRLRSDLETARLDMRRLLRADKPDRAAINRQVERMASLRSDLEKARIGMMLDVRDVLTPEQREKMRGAMLGEDGEGPEGGEGGERGSD
jgi:Spy/CpxP family protein refolding chaperone